MQEAIVTVIREAEAWIEQGQAADAIVRLQEWVERTEREGAPDARVMAALYYHLALAYRAEVQMSHARANLIRAYEQTREYAELDLLTALIELHLGELCRSEGLLGAAGDHLKEAEAYFSKASDPQNLVRTLLSLGLTYEANDEFEEAKKLLFRALSICQTAQLSEVARDVRQQYAFSVLGKQDLQLAVEELLRCAEEYRAAFDAGGEAQTFARIGAVYLQYNRMEEANQALQQALGLFTEELAARDPRIPEVYHVQAKCLMKSKNYVQASEFSELAGKLYMKMGLEKASAKALKISAQVHQQSQSKNSMKRASQWLEKEGSLDPW